MMLAVNNLFQDKLFQQMKHLIFAVILAVGVKESSRFNNLFTMVNLLVVTYIVICGSFKADPANWHIDPHKVGKWSSKPQHVGNHGDYETFSHQREIVLFLMLKLFLKHPVISVWLLDTWNRIVLVHLSVCILEFNVVRICKNFFLTC